MTTINAYLTFNGNCTEAMNFYKECLGGELTLQTIGESPMADQWPAAARNNVLHATLIKDSLVLLASDMGTPGTKGIPGNMISLSLTCSTEDELNTCYQNLAKNGQGTRPLHDFFAGKLGTVTDKYGIDWMLYYNNK